MNIALKVFWSNQPMTVAEKVKHAPLQIDIPFGVMISHPASGNIGGIHSINGKTGTNIILSADDVRADKAGTAQHVLEQLTQQLESLNASKLDALDYVQHFRGVFSSYAALAEALPTALDGDYAHIDSGSSFDRLLTIWDSSDSRWIVNDVHIASTTDEIAEGSINLYFKSERVRETSLTGLQEQNALEISHTDTVLIALAKLQAQLKATSTVTWLPAATAFTFDENVVTTSLTSWGGTIHLEVAKINGMLWLRGGFTMQSTVTAGYAIFNFKPDWKLLKSFSGNGSAGHIYGIAGSYIYNILSNDSASSGQIRCYSEWDCINTKSAETVRQAILANNQIAPKGYQISLCLGQLIMP
ncbi:hypothetical protein [Acinetobacter sp. WZC-1]|uniref:hypothetical protein n=1 Tax=Acinetobacter sp. WZC-1 TaxID=3459034 RepID=UPI00403D630E